MPLIGSLTTFLRQHAALRDGFNIIAPPRLLLPNFHHPTPLRISKQRRGRVDEDIGEARSLCRVPVWGYVGQTRQMT
jgi:hypothetical protein